MVALLVLHRLVERRVNVPLDGRKVGEAPGLHVGEAALERGEDLALVGQEVNRRPARRGLRVVAREAREPRQASQREVHLHRRTVAEVRIEAAVVHRPGRATARPRDRACGTGPRCTRRSARGARARRASTTPRTAPPSTTMRSTRRPVSIDGAGRARGLADARGDRPHAAAHEHERPVGARQAAHVVDEEVHPRPGRAPRAGAPGEAVGHGVHRAKQVAPEVEAGEVVRDGLAAQVDEDLAQRRPHVALGGLLDRQRLLEPRAAPRRSRSCAISSCSASFAFQSRSEKKRANPLPHRLAIGAEEERPSVGRGQEVVRVAPDGRDRRSPSFATSSGGMRPSRYAPVEVARSGASGKGRSVLQAPPMVAFSSTTVTRRPARARKTAATRPLWPAPRTMTSVVNGRGAGRGGGRPACRRAAGEDRAR